MTTAHLTVLGVFAIAALITTIIHAIGKCPLWVAVLFLSVIACVQLVMPLG